jgi:predicted Zn-dependent peptidase
MKFTNISSKRVNGIHLHTVKTDKFKTNSITLKLKAPLDERTVTMRALLPYVLQSGTSEHPSALQIRSYLDELYGATLHVDISKKGEYQLITFRMDIANENYLNDSTPLLEKALSLLSQILLSPAGTGQSFDDAIIDKEKRSLKQKIDAVYDDKMRYANMRLLEEMCQAEPYRLQPLGKSNEVDGITSESLFQYYKQVLADDEVDLYLVGDLSADEVLQSVEKYFVFPHQRSDSHEKASVTSKQPSEVREVVDKQEVKQGKLHLGFRTNITYGDPDYFALQLFNGIFGGFSHSKLFINVREKASLAYYAASRVESHKGLLLVMSGIEFGNYNQAVDIIKQQMEEMRSGNFSDDEISQTKAVIRNQILETIDTAGGLVEILYHNVVAGSNRTLDDWLTEIDNVSREEIVNVASKIQLDTIYFLTGLESAE